MNLQSLATCNSFEMKAPSGLDHNSAYAFGDNSRRHSTLKRKCCDSSECNYDNAKVYTKRMLPDKGYTGSLVKAEAEYFSESGVSKYEDDFLQHLYSDGIHAQETSSIQNKAMHVSSSAVLGFSEGAKYCPHYPKCLHSTRSRKWSHVEEVLLLGVVFERLFHGGSLSNYEKAEFKSSGNIKQDGWTYLKLKYDSTKASYIYLLKNSAVCPFQERTALALKRHYKVRFTFSLL